MSTDLIHRLRVSASEWLPTSDHTLRAHKLLEEAAGALESLTEEAERTARNRDMWKGQCERQAAELGALRVDAERYRWLRDSEMLVWPSVDLANACHRAAHKGAPELIDAAVDAARMG